MLRAGLQGRWALGQTRPLTYPAYLRRQPRPEATRLLGPYQGAEQPRNQSLTGRSAASVHSTRPTSSALWCDPAEEGTASTHTPVAGLPRHAANASAPNTRNS